MRIAIDAHHIGDRRTGTETYLYHLVKNLALLPPNGETYSIYLNQTAEVEGIEGRPNFESRRLPFSKRAFRYGVFYPLESWQKRFDVLHVQFTLPPSLRSRSVVTVHDLCYEHFPQFFRPSVRALMKTLVPWSCRRADHVITVSESSKRDLVELYGIQPSRITVTYPGAGSQFRPMDRDEARTIIRTTYGVGDDFIVYVGNLEPRKNLRRLLDAFFLLKEQNKITHKLLIVGQASWLAKDIIAAAGRGNLSKEVVFTGYVPAEDLPRFYSAATAMVYPSLFEGFGLPVVEAMACGTPVITSFGSSLEEIAGDAALLVDPYSTSAIASAIEKVANDPHLQRSLREAGLKRSGMFSFRRMAEQTCQVYHRL